MRGDAYPPLVAVRQVVAAALAEDLLPLGDLTGGLLAPGARCEAAFVAREAGVVAGMACVAEVFAQVDPRLVLVAELDDGDQVAAGGVIAVASGPSRSLLGAERSALNFLGHLSGVATLARRFVEAAALGDPRARVWDTRKTTPGLRALEKAAVRAGGAANHRGSLSEAVLIKDNHLGGLAIGEAVALAQERWPGRMLEVECESLGQVQEALDAGATLVMCDNMSPAEVAAAVSLVREHTSRCPGSVLVEASGGVTLENVADYARSGVDVISVGAITHSAPVLDIGLDLLSEPAPDGALR